MKYLRPYKLFESNPSYRWTKTGRYEVIGDRMKDEIFDILRDCEDLGLKVMSPRVIKNEVSIEISFLENRDEVSNLPPSFGEIKPSIEHLVSYMKSIGYSEFRYFDNISGFNRRRVYNILPPVDKKNRESYVSLSKIIFSD